MNVNESNQAEGDGHDAIDGAVEGETVTTGADVDINDIGNGMTITPLVGNGNNDVISRNVRKLYTTDGGYFMTGGGSTNGNINTGSDGSASDAQKMELCASMMGRMITSKNTNSKRTIKSDEIKSTLSGVTSLR